MLTPPPDLPDDLLVAALARHWAIEVVGLEYLPVGFGSHHWAVTGAGDRRWFVTVDEPAPAAFERLLAALGTAAALRADGLDFVVAPLPAADGAVAVRMGERFAVACYPHVAGRHFDFGEFREEDHRRAVLDMLVAVHKAARPAVTRADDYTIAHRDEVEAMLSGAPIPATGPYAEPMRDLLRDTATALRRGLARYDALVAAARAHADRAVVTHGEPHAGNTIHAPDGWRLIDWDTALLAPPERDLWDLDPGDDSVLAAYTAATGVVPEPGLLDLYRLRWDLTDAAEYVHRFRWPHTGSEDDVKSWKNLRELISRLAELP
ncbi:phosphotransferase [Nocardia terpenica]|uniref:Phosphotransferase n=1 Tax=Nocardia terpenica TaxID=455432 RepID=A0A6G9ZBH4_9NOCA|nr:phosphotransferase [Nocardia terpenica]QIS22969.1 phosphotransferase [Nocardia terpenica]